MSPEAEAAVIGGIAGGAVGGILGGIGVVVGLFVERWVRSWGGVLCEIEGFGGPVDERDSGLARLKVDQSVRAYFFNDKEVDTGLSELAVVFVFEDGHEVVLGPETRFYETSTSPRGVINLPSKTWVSVEIKGTFYGPPAERLDLRELPKTIGVKGKFPGGKPYRERCLELS